MRGILLLISLLLAESRQFDNSPPQIHYFNVNEENLDGPFNRKKFLFIVYDTPNSQKYFPPKVPLLQKIELLGFPSVVIDASSNRYSQLFKAKITPELFELGIHHELNYLDEILQFALLDDDPHSDESLKTQSPTKPGKQDNITIEKGLQSSINVDQYETELSGEFTNALKAVKEDSRPEENNELHTTKTTDNTFYAASYYLNDLAKNKYSYAGVFMIGRGEGAALVEILYCHRANIIDAYVSLTPPNTYISHLARCASSFDTNVKTDFSNIIVNSKYPKRLAFNLLTLQPQILPFVSKPKDDSYPDLLNKRKLAWRKKIMMKLEISHGKVAEEEKKLYFSLLSSSKKLFSNFKKKKGVTNHDISSAYGGDKISHESFLKNHDSPYAPKNNEAGFNRITEKKEEIPASWTSLSSCQKLRCNPDDYRFHNKQSIGKLLSKQVPVFHINVPANTDASPVDKKKRLIDFDMSDYAWKKNKTKNHFVVISEDMPSMSPLSVVKVGSLFPWESDLLERHAFHGNTPSIKANQQFLSPANKLLEKEAPNTFSSTILRNQAERIKAVNLQISEASINSRRNHSLTKTNVSSMIKMFQKNAKKYPQALVNSRAGEVLRKESGEGENNDEASKGLLIPTIFKSSSTQVKEDNPILKRRCFLQISEAGTFWVKMLHGTKREATKTNIFDHFHEGWECKFKTLKKSNYFYSPANFFSDDNTSSISDDGIRVSSYPNMSFNVDNLKQQLNNKDDWSKNVEEKKDENSMEELNISFSSEEQISLQPALNINNQMKLQLSSRITRNKAHLNDDSGASTQQYRNPSVCVQDSENPAGNNCEGAMRNNGRYPSMFSPNPLIEKEERRKETIVKNIFLKHSNALSNLQKAERGRSASPTFSANNSTSGHYRYRSKPKHSKKKAPKVYQEYVESNRNISRSAAKTNKQSIEHEGKLQELLEEFVNSHAKEDNYTRTHSLYHFVVDEAPALVDSSPLQRKETDPFPLIGNYGAYDSPHANDVSLLGRLEIFKLILEGQEDYDSVTGDIEFTILLKLIAQYELIHSASSVNEEKTSPLPSSLFEMQAVQKKKQDKNYNREDRGINENKWSSNKCLSGERMKDFHAPYSSFNVHVHAKREDEKNLRSELSDFQTQGAEMIEECNLENDWYEQNNNEKNEVVSEKKGKENGDKWKNVDLRKDSRCGLMENYYTTATKQENSMAPIELMKVPTLKLQSRNDIEFDYNGSPFMQTKRKKPDSVIDTISLPWDALLFDEPLQMTMSLQQVLSAHVKLIFQSLLVLEDRLETETLIEQPDTIASAISLFSESEAIDFLRSTISSGVIWDLVPNSQLFVDCLMSQEKEKAKELQKQVEDRHLYKECLSLKIEQSGLFRSTDNKSQFAKLSKTGTVLQKAPEQVIKKEYLLAKKQKSIEASQNSGDPTQNTSYDVAQQLENNKHNTRGFNIQSIISKVPLENTGKQTGITKTHSKKDSISTHELHQNEKHAIDVKFSTAIHQIDKSLQETAVSMKEGQCIENYESELEDLFPKNVIEQIYQYLNNKRLNAKQDENKVLSPFKPYWKRKTYLNLHSKSFSYTTLIGTPFSLNFTTRTPGASQSIDSSPKKSEFYGTSNFEKVRKTEANEKQKFHQLNLFSSDIEIAVVQSSHHHSRDELIQLFHKYLDLSNDSLSIRTQKPKISMSQTPATYIMAETDLCAVFYLIRQRKYYPSLYVQTKHLISSLYREKERENKMMSQFMMLSQLCEELPRFIAHMGQILNLSNESVTSYCMLILSSIVHFHWQNILSHYGVAAKTVVEGKNFSLPYINLSLLSAIRKIGLQDYVILSQYHRSRRAVDSMGKLALQKNEQLNELEHVVSSPLVMRDSKATSGGAKTILLNKKSIFGESKRKQESVNTKSIRTDAYINSFVSKHPLLISNFDSSVNTVVGSLAHKIIPPLNLANEGLGKLIIEGIENSAFNFAPQLPLLLMVAVIRASFLEIVDLFSVQPLEFIVYTALRRIKNRSINKQFTASKLSVNIKQEKNQSSQLQSNHENEFSVYSDDSSELDAPFSALSQRHTELQSPSVSSPIRADDTIVSAAVQYMNTPLGNEAIEVTKNIETKMEIKEWTNVRLMTKEDQKKESQIVKSILYRISNRTFIELSNVIRECDENKCSETGEVPSIYAGTIRSVIDDLKLLYKKLHLEFKSFYKRIFALHQITGGEANRSIVSQFLEHLRQYDWTKNSPLTRFRTFSRKRKEPLSPSRFFQKYVPMKQQSQVLSLLNKHYHTKPSITSQQEPSNPRLETTTHKELSMFEVLDSLLRLLFDAESLGLKLYSEITTLLNSNSSDLSKELKTENTIKNNFLKKLFSKDNTSSVKGKSDSEILNSSITPTGMKDEGLITTSADYYGLLNSILSFGSISPMIASDDPSFGPDGAISQIIQSSIDRYNRLADEKNSTLRNKRVTSLFRNDNSKRNKKHLSPVNSAVIKNGRGVNNNCLIQHVVTPLLSSLKNLCTKSLKLIRKEPQVFTGVMESPTIHIFKSINAGVRKSAGVYRKVNNDVDGYSVYDYHVPLTTDASSSQSNKNRKEVSQLTPLQSVSSYFTMDDYVNFCRGMSEWNVFKRIELQNKEIVLQYKMENDIFDSYKYPQFPLIRDNIPNLSQKQILHSTVMKQNTTTGGIYSVEEVANNLLFTLENTVHFLYYGSSYLDSPGHFLSSHPLIDILQTEEFVPTSGCHSILTDTRLSKEIYDSTYKYRTVGINLNLPLASESAFHSISKGFCVGTSHSLNNVLKNKVLELRVYEDHNKMSFVKLPVNKVLQQTVHASFAEAISAAREKTKSKLTPYSLFLRQNFDLVLPFALWENTKTFLKAIQDTYKQPEQASHQHDFSIKHDLNQDVDGVLPSPSAYLLTQRNKIIEKGRKIDLKNKQSLKNAHINSSIATIVSLEFLPRSIHGTFSDLMKLLYLFSPFIPSIGNHHLTEKKQSWRDIYRFLLTKYATKKCAHCSQNVQHVFDCNHVGQSHLTDRIGNNANDGESRPKNCNSSLKTPCCGSDSSPGDKENVIIANAMCCQEEDKTNKLGLSDGRAGETSYQHSYEHMSISPAKANNHVTFNLHKTQHRTILPFSYFSNAPAAPSLIQNTSAKDEIVAMENATPPTILKYNYSVKSNFLQKYESQPCDISFVKLRDRRHNTLHDLKETIKGKLNEMKVHDGSTNVLKSVIDSLIEAHGVKASSLEKHQCSISQYIEIIYNLSLANEELSMWLMSSSPASSKDIPIDANPVINNNVSHINKVVSRTKLSDNNRPWRTSRNGSPSHYSDNNSVTHGEETDRRAVNGVPTRYEYVRESRNAVSFHLKQRINDMLEGKI